MGDTINLEPTTVTASPAARAPSDTELLAALQAAHDKGDTQAAMAIAEMMSAQPVTHEPQTHTGNTSGSGIKQKPMSSLSSGDDTLQFGPLDTHIPLPSSTADQLAGVGSAFHDIGQGIGQKLGFTSAKDVHESRALDRELMHSANGRIGNILGNAAAFAPAAMLPGGQGVAASILTGAGLGAMQPSESLGEQSANTGIGAALGPVAHALPEAGRLIGKIPGVKTVGNYLSSMMPGGSGRAARRILGDAATMQGDTSLARLNLENASKSGALADKYGINPTTAQLAQSPGIASLDRTLRNEPKLANGFNDRDDANREAIDNILTGISGSPTDRLRAQAARDHRATSMYDDALNNPEHFVQPPDPAARSFEAEEASKTGLPNANGKPSTNDPSAPAAGLNDMGLRLQEILKRPAVADAMNNASRQAANRGKTLDSRNLIQQMHYAKIHLDGKISQAMNSGDTTELGGLMDSKNALVAVMDDLSPAYAEARGNFRTASRPLNRMEVGEALRQKYSPGLGDMGSTSRNPATFVNALRDGDSIAQRATDFNGATLANTLHPMDLEALNEAAHQLGRQSYAQGAGKAVGSNTGQNIANREALDEVGSLHSMLPPEGVGAAGIALALHHPALIPLGITGSLTKTATKAKLADTMLHPDVARDMLNHQSLTDKYLPEGVGYTGAGLNADQNDQGYADGGPVDMHGNPIHKPTFWELVKTAAGELTGSDADDASTAPVGQGAVRHAADQIQANPHRQMDIADSQS